MKTTGQKIAPFHLPATGKVAIRASAQTPPIRQGRKRQGEHFRDQLRAVAQDVKPGSQDGTDDPEVATTKGRLAADLTGELTDEIKARSKGRDGQSRDKLAPIGCDRCPRHRRRHGKRRTLP